MGLFSKKVSCIGLDIGEHLIKIMEIRKTGQGYEVVGFGIVPTPPGLIEGSAIVNEQGVVAALQNLVGSISNGSANVAMAVSGDHVIVRNLVVPVMPDDELAEAIRYEAEALLPISLSDVTIDFVKYDITEDASGRLQEILVVAVKNEAIDRLVRIGAAVGLEPTIMDIEPLALLRAIRKLDRAAISRDENCAIVNIGSSSTNISVFKHGQLAFTRTLVIGGHRLSLSLVNQGHMSMEEAEAAKRLMSLQEESDPGKPAGPNDQTTEILIPLIDELVTEISRSLEYYMAQHREQEIAQVFITGGGIRLKGLAPYINRRLGMTVRVFDPTDYLQLKNDV